MLLGSLFQNGAVFQRHKPIPVQGKTVPGQLVAGTLAGKESFCRSSQTGDFMLYFPALPAGGPYELHVFLPEVPGEQAVVKDILIGEVWLASGQSNMEYPLNADWRTDPDGEAEPLARQQEQEFKNSVSDPDKIRFFKVARMASGARETAVSGEWQKMTADNAGECSAVGAWFGKFLQENLGIPVGVIVSAWGGTVVEAWTSLNALFLNPDSAECAAEVMASHGLRKCYASPEGFTVPLADVDGVEPDPGISAAAQNWADRDFDDSGWQPMILPGSWVQQEIAGNGAVWIRREVTVPEDWIGCDLILHTGGIDKHDISFVNGTEVGRTGKDLETAWYDKPRNYPVPGTGISDRRVVVACRGFSFCHDGSFLGKWKLIRVSDGAEIDLSGTWKAKAEYDRGLIVPNRQKSAFGAGCPNTPGILFDGMIRPLLPYALRGAIWYQGESNAASHAAYYKALQNMISDWRYHWMMPDMPFIMVQLAGYGMYRPFAFESFWAHLREAQRLLCDDFPQTYMVSAIDRGEANDIHPQDKKSVGYRLAQNALCNVYGRTDIIPAGPAFCGASQAEDGRIRLNFRNAAGLVLREDMEQAFYVSADGKKFIPADSAVVEGENILLQSALEYISEVRYAWSDNPPCTLFNGAGLPAPSFRGKIENKN